MQITETDCTSGVTIERAMSIEEQTRHESELALLAEIEAQRESSRLARESALAKLQAIGLTEEEVSSLL